MSTHTLLPVGLWLTTLASLVLAVPFANTTTCTSYGVDFKDGGSYFINSASSEPFTAISQFSGCSGDPASILLVLPNSDELDCGTVPTSPDFTNELATCPVTKGGLVSGEYLLLLLGNNGADAPFAYQRQFSLDVGPQATATSTQTISLTSITTPVVTSTSTSTSTLLTTLPANSTVTVPNSSAAGTKTLTPWPKYTVATHTATWTRTRWVFAKRSTVSTTVTATCTLPPRAQQPDPMLQFKPRHALPYGFKLPRGAEKRDSLPSGLAGLAKRAPDAPTVTVTASDAVYTTITVTGAPSTNVLSTVVTATATITPPPETVVAAPTTVTVTLPPKTRTILRYTWTVSATTRTIAATRTITTTVTPSSVKEECKRNGGHFWGRW
ncbi:hypothetical protein EJ06DRAFT_581652 [Trichodelitschia bisporula]|uniref:Uncharacterized protein n=1 Tax=Trichodelitschia bisporula TaxID=703511 RepID=A0A6G1I028_9PEZI|nr:hypothetical protein EJ06DRAFT_581652 [Trichodelitschia bisporula]